MTARSVMGTAQGAMGTFRRLLEAPSPAPQILPWRCAATTTFSNPWVQKVCRRDEGTPPQQSQPVPELLTRRAASTAAAGRSLEHSSRLGGDQSLRPGLWDQHAGQGRGDRGCQGLPAAAAGTHDDTQTGTLATSMAASTSRGGEAAGAAGGPGLPVTPPSPGSPSPARCPPPHPLPVPTSGAGTGGRGQITAHPNLPKGLLHGVGSSAFPRPGWGLSTGWGRTGGHWLPRTPPTPGQWPPPTHTHTPALPPHIGRPFFVPPWGESWRGQCSRGRGQRHQRPPRQRAVPLAGLLPPASPRRGVGDQHPQRYGAQPVLSFSSSFFFSFFCFGRPGAWSRLAPPPRATPPHPCPWGGGMGRAAATCHPSAIRRRSLLLWPGPSALCLCPAVRLSCSPSPGGPRSARSRGVRSLRSGRSS